jgi:hypothetical protein
LARCGGSLHRETHYRVAGSLRLVESVVPRLVEETFALRGLPAPRMLQIGEPLHSVPRHEGGRLRGMLSEFSGGPLRIGVKTT